MPITSKENNIWIGGKPAGCIGKQLKWAQVSFSKNLNIPSRCFTYSHYNNEEEALQAAF